MNHTPEPDDGHDDGPAEGERLPLDREQLAFLTRHMGRVIGDDEWAAALDRPKPPPPGGG